MKGDTDTIRSFLFGLLEHFSRTVSSPSGKVVDVNETRSNPTQLSEPLEAFSNNPGGVFPNPPDSESLSPTFSNELSTEMPPISELGEMPSVQNHFQTVLKRRLQIEISQNPPLFPWESDLQEYPVELSTSSPFPWLVQLRSLQLPTTLPEDVLSSLLSRCQELAAETLKPGIQLVKAVDSLFPEHPQVMNEVAGLVLNSATVRSSGQVRALDVEAVRKDFPDGYEGANPQQQVTLAMLAARDILDTLTITLTPHQPTVQREWLTTEGNVVLAAHYQSKDANQVDTNQIVLSVDLPQAGQLSLPSSGQTVTRNHPGKLNLSLPEPDPEVAYPFEIYLSDLDSIPLTFSIRWKQ